LICECALLKTRDPYTYILYRLAVRDEAHDDPDSGYIAWKLDNVTANRIAVLGMRDSDSVDTDIDMTGNQDKAGDVWVQPSFGE